MAKETKPARAGANAGANASVRTGAKAGAKKEKDPFADRSPMGLLKREVVEKLGLLDKVKSSGWGGLTAAESGRVGALMNRLLKERRTEEGERAER